MTRRTTLVLLVLVAFTAAMAALNFAVGSYGMGSYAVGVSVFCGLYAVIASREV